MTSELFTLRGAIVVGCMLLAAVSTDAAIRLFHRTQHPDTTADSAIGLTVMGFAMLLFAGAMVAFAWNAAFHLTLVVNQN